MLVLNLLGKDWLYGSFSIQGWSREEQISCLNQKSCLNQTLFNSFILGRVQSCLNRKSSSNRTCLNRKTTVFI